MQDKRILYIEDHPLNAEILRRIIRKLWHIEIDIAGSAEDGLKELERAAYDLVYMDIHLPGMSGLETTSLIKENPHTAMVPVIAVTADASPQAQEEVKEAGGDGYVAKPIDVQVLKKITEDIMQIEPLPA